MYFDGSQQNFEFFVLSIDQKVKMVDATGNLQQGKKMPFQKPLDEINPSLTTNMYINGTQRNQKICPL